MKAILLIDFGSTYTKLTAVDVAGETLLGTAAAYTTVESDIGDGLREGLNILRGKIGNVVFEERYACSSAAGGLRMVASGLVPELTSEAAKVASFGAGAKVVGEYSFRLTDEDLEEIQALKPDIFLLVGGIDGGNSECIIHNAGMLAKLAPSFPIVIAGNRNAAAECKKCLAAHETHICENVMPKFGTLNIEPTQKKIREIFLNRIIEAKGLSRTEKLLDNIMMPTPSAVLQAMELLSFGTDTEPGIGDLIAVDVGGATTDVYSIADGMPESLNTVYQGLPEPYSKRTVEGDIGMRYSVHGVVDAVGSKTLAALSGLTPERVGALADELREHPDLYPKDTPELEAMDFALASAAVETAVARHAGTIRETYTLLGKTYVQTGKDLTRVKQIVVTGGSLIHSDRAEEIAAHAKYSPRQPESLRPLQAQVLVDRNYIISAMGLLSDRYPQAALRIMKKELERHGIAE